MAVKVLHTALLNFLVSKMLFYTSLLQTNQSVFSEKIN